MTRSWQTLDSVDTPDGRLELRQRGADDFLIAIGGRVLMNSRASRSEESLGTRACQAVASRETTRVLIGGLGMGFTLRAALDALPKRARVEVAELTPAIVRWCAGPLARLTGAATRDPRVRVTIADVADRIAAASDSPRARYDAIVLDLYEGPHRGPGERSDPVYGDAALRAAGSALRPGGILAIWSEHRDSHFEQRLRASGFDFDVERPGRGGLRHAIYLARGEQRRRC